MPTANAASELGSGRTSTILAMDGYSCFGGTPRILVSDAQAVPLSSVGKQGMDIAEPVTAYN
jgi:hypothetical protein